MKNSLPEVRRGKLKQDLQSKKHLRALEASNGLMGLIVEKASAENKEFDAMWLSSLCDSAMKGKPDNEVVDFSSRVKTIEEIMEVTKKPIIVDGDTGGAVEHFIWRVQTLERMGVSAVVIEDKKGLKQNSLLEDCSVQILEEKEAFAEKIKQGKKHLKTQDFMIIARIESFIAGKDLEDAMSRADAYIKAGADGIMIHSNKKDGKEVLEFMKKFKNQYKDVPLVVVPTMYHQYKDVELFKAGASIVIYANHMLRSAYQVMTSVARQILKEECSKEVSESYCASVEEILKVIGDSYD